MFPIVKTICERMTNYIDEKIESGVNTMIAKDVGKHPMVNFCVSQLKIVSLIEHIARRTIYGRNDLQLRLWIRQQLIRRTFGIFERSKESFESVDIDIDSSFLGDVFSIVAQNLSNIVVVEGIERLVHKFDGASH